MLATVASITSANRLRRRLSESGIDARVVQTPASLAREGCGYSLRFDDSYKTLAQSAAADLKIKIRAFFYERIQDGQKKYIKV